MSIESMDNYHEQIKAGKQIIVDYLQKERLDYAEKFNGFGWVPRSSDDITFGIHRLVIYIGDKCHTIKFEETDLADAPETPGWDRRLKKMIDQFFKELERNGNIKLTDEH